MSPPLLAAMRRAFVSLNGASTAVDASIGGTEFCGNTSLFASSTLGVQLLSALGDTIPDDSTGVNDVVHHPSGVTSVGGAFTLTTGPASGSSNIIAFKDDALTALAGNGLNGEVTSLLLDGGHLYVGGAFDDTNEGTAASSLSAIAMYDVASGAWSSLGAGIDGRVASITLIDDMLHVGGSCAEGLAALGGSGRGGIDDDGSGYAAWHIKAGRWIKSGWPTNKDIGFVVGKMSFLNSSINAQFVGGFQYRPMGQPLDKKRTDVDEDGLVPNQCCWILDFSGLSSESFMNFVLNLIQTLLLIFQVRASLSTLGESPFQVMISVLMLLDLLCCCLQLFGILGDFP
jgi:hypothetical protein